MSVWEQKNVLITGAGRGIGKRLAIGFAAKGARVGLLARSKAELDLTHMEIEQAGGRAIRLRADVANYAQLRAAVDRFRTRFGEVDVAVCAAAVVGPIGAFWESSPKAWDAAIQTNLLGVCHTCRAVLPSMVARRRGKILVLACAGAIRPQPGFSAYAASKTAVVRLVETVAEEVRDYNVQINCLHPGPTYTHMTDVILRAGSKVGAKEREEAERLRSTGGTTPDKQIELALFLASEEANHISGKLIHIRDDWRRLRDGQIDSELLTLRRVRRR